ncbi:hypothetical protein [Streptomyces guryensis]|uniref:hypothetical protein n=1 Tax=Streptomyces guryensis TaxID=2886947 RepID=UPI00355877D4
MAEIARRTIIGAGERGRRPGRGRQWHGSRCHRVSSRRRDGRRPDARPCFPRRGRGRLPGHGSIRLAQSYTDQAGLFSTAFTYDNALAILAHLAHSSTGSRARAVSVGDALLYAQAHDPQHADGRPRQAYNVGPYVFYDGSPQPDGFVRTDGSVNVGTQFGFTGTAVGYMAWASIALSAPAHRTRAWRFLAGAVLIGEWVEAHGLTDEPLGASPLYTGFGFGFGYHPYRHVGATAWYLLAAARANPLRGR